MSAGQKITLKILALYVVSSFIFLGIFFYGWFLQEEKSLARERILTLHKQTHFIVSEVYEQIKTSRDIKNVFQKVSEITQTPFALMGKNGEVLFSSIQGDLSFLKESFGGTIDFKYEKSVKHHHNKIYILSKDLGGKIHRIDEIRSKYPKNYLILVAQSQGIQKEIHRLFISMGLAFLLSVCVIGGVAYFLVKLSLKPLEEKIESLNAFIKDSTHEINTPLSVILMSIERIEAQDLQKKDRKKFERIKLAAKSLSQIYSDLLFYNFPHTLDERAENVDLEKLIEERILYFSPFFVQKNITLQKNLKQVIIFVDRSKMIRVVDNLLSNALKYTHNGGRVDIYLSLECLKITDNGCGIKKEDREKIFERYYRSNLTQGGFGIGLAVVKRICDSYGITLRCESIVKKESSFILEFNKNILRDSR